MPGAPGAPLLEVRHQSLGVSWSPPTENGGSAVTGYKVGRCSSGCDTDANWTVATPTGTGTSFTLTGLTNGTEYQVRVAAGNRSGDGGWSSPSSGTPAPQPPDAPTAPTTTVDDQSVTVTWSPPTSNGAAITGYDVRYRVQDDNGAWPATWTSHTHTGTATTATIGNLAGAISAGAISAEAISAEAISAGAISADAGSLTNGTEYQVQVRAINGVGVGAWSPQPPDTPDAPTTTARHQGLTVSWSAPTENGSAITGYDVRYRVKGLRQRHIRRPARPLGHPRPRRYRHHRHDRQPDQQHRLPSTGESRKAPSETAAGRPQGTASPPRRPRTRPPLRH